MRNGVSPHENADRGEELFLRDTHGGQNVNEEGRGEIMALGVLGVSVALPTHKKTCALSDGGFDMGFQARKGIRGNHGADVDVWVVEGGAKAEGADAGFEERDEFGVSGREGDDALDANAILASGLEDAAEKDGCDFGERGGVVKDDGRVFAAELDADRNKGFGGGGADGVGNGPGANKCDVAD